MFSPRKQRVGRYGNEEGTRRYIIEHGLPDYQPLYETQLSLFDQTDETTLSQDTAGLAPMSMSLPGWFAHWGPIAQRSAFPVSITAPSWVSTGMRWTPARETAICGKACMGRRSVRSVHGGRTFLTKATLSTRNWHKYWSCVAATRHYDEGDSFCILYRRTARLCR